MSASLILIPILLPLAALIPVLLMPRRAFPIALATLGACTATALALLAEVWTSGQAPTLFVGGWAPPLGVALRADGFACAMLLMATLCALAIVLFARAPYGAAEGSAMRAGAAFWALTLCIVGALGLAFLAQDLFTLYVALELLTFGAVPLVCLEGKPQTFAAALRYLLFALIGSMLYLLGAVMIYGAYGTLDITLLAAAARADGPTLLALALMTAGLLAKAALFPLHLWLPPAHAGAPAAASALLSALVIKAPLFLVVRLWVDALPQSLTAPAATLLAGLGAGAILICGAFALAQRRLKLLIAYSTAAQIGYLFLMLPLLGSLAGPPWASLAFSGGALHLISHAFSKAAMFLAAGLLAEAAGHDRIAGLTGIARARPLSVFAFGLGGLSLMGLPPSGGFIAKIMLLNAAVRAEAWWIALVILTGGLMAGAYVLKVLLPAMRRADGDGPPLAKVSRGREAIALALALGAVALGFVPLEPFALFQAGRPASYAGMLP